MTRRERRALRIAADRGDLAARAKIRSSPAVRDRLVRMLEAKQVTFDARVSEAQGRIAPIEESIRAAISLLELKGETAMARQLREELSIR